MKLSIILALTFILGILTAACGAGQPEPGPQASPQSADPTPTMIAPESGTGGIRLSSPNAGRLWHSSLPVQIWAAPFIEGEDGQGIYVLEPSIHPTAIMDPSGVFQVNNVPPGKYVLVVGPVPEESVVVQKDGDVWIVEVKAGEVTDLGSIFLE